MGSDAGMTARWCKVCGALEVYGYGRCYNCYRYYYRHKRERPRHFWDKNHTCKTCGVPLSSLGVYDDGVKVRRRQVKGRCHACRIYLYRCKRERPERLWGIGPAGWCECGFPAVAVVEDNPVCNRHKG